MRRLGEVFCPDEGLNGLYSVSMLMIMSIMYDILCLRVEKRQALC